MAITNINWRYINDSGALYVHSILGNDQMGDGTRQNPYRTIRQAVKHLPKKYTINCLGVFSEPLSDFWYDGTNWTTIRGDYWGGAVFDGKDENILYGCITPNWIFKNVPAGSSTIPVYPVTNNSGLLAGVGRGYINAGGVSSVGSVGASAVLLHECGLYFGGIGGTTACQKVIYSKPRCNSTYKLWFVTYTWTRQEPSQCVAYDVPLSKRQYSRDNTTGANGASVNLHNFKRWIFAKCAMFANDLYMRYSGCLFTADTEWHLDTSGINKITYADMDREIASGKAKDRGEAIISILRGLNTSADRMPIFENCIFSDKTSDEVFNNAECQDFTLKYYPENPAILPNNEYIGALPPAVNIPILANSNGVVGCWDNRTLSGCLSVADNNIIVDPNSTADNGHILSKVLKIDPYYLQFSGVYGLMEDHFNTQKVVTNINRLWGKKYVSGETLPNGRYVVIGGEVSFDDLTFYAGDVINKTTGDDATFLAESDAVLYELRDSNIENLLYCRCRSAIYAHLKSSDTLQQGGIYINNSNSPITYRNRQIAPYESFICEDTTTFTAPDGVVGVMFDDTRVPESEWIPANAWGEYFVYKKHGVIQKDNTVLKVPISSGNSLSYQTSANGGYSDTLTKSIMNQEYVQFAIFVNKINS